MSDKDPSDPDELLEKLLAKHGPEAGDMDPAARALHDDPTAQASLETFTALRERPAPPPPEAPDPVELPGETSAMIIQAEAAATYVGPVKVTPPEAPRLPSGPVRIKTEMDPRRAKTMRVAHVPATVNAKATAEAESRGEELHANELRGERPRAAGLRGGGARASEAAHAESGRDGDENGRDGDEPVSASKKPPSMGKASARDGGRDTLRRGMWIGGLVVLVAVVGTLGLLGRNGHRGGTGAGAMATSSGPAPLPVSGGARAVAAGGAHVEAPVASMTATVAEPVNAAPSASVASALATTTATATPVPSVTIAPQTSGDPYVDAAAPPAKSAPSVEPSVTTAPAVTAAPAVTDRPSVTPPATTAAPTVAPKTTSTGVIPFFERGQEKK